jgi:hypothetical protein
LGHTGPWRLLLNEVVKLRKTNYRQQKKTREEARKVRNAEKQERRQTSTTKLPEPGDAQTTDSKSPQGIESPP